MLFPKPSFFVVALATSSLALQLGHTDGLLHERQLELEARESDPNAREYDLDLKEISLEARALGDRVRCRNVVNGDFIIKKDDASSAIHYAPLAPKDEKVTGSGYPHEFQNKYNPITWPNTKCNHLPVGGYLLEFPVFPNGRPYDYTKKPKDDPGVARAIYTWPFKDLCGVIAHEGDATNPNLGGLKLCANL